MTRHVLWMGLTWGMMIALVGCNGIGGGAEAGAIVGNWEMNCSKLPDEDPERDWFMREEVSYQSNGTYSGRYAYFSDSQCTNREGMHPLNGRYTTGGTTTAHDGKAATEIDTSGDKTESYGMYRLTDTDTLYLSWSREGHDGSSPEKRRDVFAGYPALKRK